MMSTSPLKHIQSLVPSASEDQLDGFLRSNYTFSDHSVISRHIFRPYWKYISSRSPNFPPTFLLSFSLVFTLASILILSYNDPDFTGTSIPRSIWFVCLLCHLGTLTCSGVDAAGRLGRREDSHSVYSSVEYLDRALEGCCLCFKTMCIFHISGLGEGRLDYLYAYVVLVCVLGCFLCQQWEGSATGNCRTSAFIDALELGLLTAFVFKTLVGNQSYWLGEP